MQPSVKSNPPRFMSWATTSTVKADPTFTSALEGTSAIVLALDTITDPARMAIVRMKSQIVFFIVFSSFNFLFLLLARPQHVEVHGICSAGLTIDRDHGSNARYL